MDAYLHTARKIYHKRLLDSILTTSEAGVPSNADKSSLLSKRISLGILERLEVGTIAEKVAGQTSGKEYETINREFIEATFRKLSHICCGDWVFKRMGNRDKRGISEFEQFAHLLELNRLTKESSVLATVLGNDYTITPDIVVAKLPFEDAVINAQGTLVDGDISLQTAARKSNGAKPILHASISSKWTIRSDRSQNSRTEALNLIRNRKGRLPHIVVVTAEPMPSRIASVAMGTGDIDCVYHSMLYELIDTVNTLGAEDAQEMLRIMIEGKRLKDISDLPLDLTV
ncbi:MAG: NgoMIV family type II restriction endonuclease [Oscillospiraceae bacterium]|nr:NgoMIV family type II restriction endonuclease [Oscillospiraceae bacterium]